jgi:hypothetical protein
MVEYWYGEPEKMSLTTKLALGGAAIATGIILMPYIAPAIGLGSIDIAESTLFGMHNITEGTGAAGMLNGVVASIPLIGTELAKGGLTSIAATAITGLGGVLLGDRMSQGHKPEDGIDWGRVIRWAGLATSALIALPAVLTGISNGVVYMVNEATASGFISFEYGAELVNNAIGMIGVLPYQEPMNMGLSGVAATLPHLITCGATMFPLAISVGTGKALKHRHHGPDMDNDDPTCTFVARGRDGQPLAFTDPNNYLTPDETDLVERYNSAKPTEKPLLKKEILGLGYTPDFHDDGTVHLFRHVHHAGMAR